MVFSRCVGRGAVLLSLVPSPRGRAFDIHLAGFVLKWQPRTAQRKERISCIRSIKDGHWDAYKRV
jgi:hypothetical protein